MGMEGHGRLFNVVAAASGVGINMRTCSGVTFLSFLDAGTQTLTLTQTIAGASSTNLAVITRIYKGPGVGGTWTKVTQAAANTFNLTTDATNDAFTCYVGADQLADTYTHVVGTVGSGILVAIIHDLTVQRAPQNLATSL